MKRLMPGVFLSRKFVNNDNMDFLFHFDIIFNYYCKIKIIIIIIKITL